MVKKRDYSLDRLGGVLILYMILGHTVSLTTHVSPSPAVETFYRYCSALFFFYMPWFFYKSGMFFHDEDVNTTILKGRRRLLRPWIIWSMIGLAVGFVIAMINQEVFRFFLRNGYTLLLSGAIQDNAPLWFLISLFAVRTIFVWLRNIKISVWLIIVGSVVLPFALSFIPNFRPYYLANVFLGLFFFSLGNLLANSIFLKNNKWLALIIIPVTIVFFFSPQFVDFRTNTLLEGNYLMYCILCILAILGWNATAKLFDSCKMNWGGVFCSIGKHSIFYYCTHWVVLTVLIEIYKKFLSGTQLFVWCFITLFIVLLVLEYSLRNKYDRYF